MGNVHPRFWAWVIGSGVPLGALAELLAATMNPNCGGADHIAGYVEAQEKVAQAWRDKANWTRMSILNTASSGFFSTDRTMQEYNADIWKLAAGRR